jgi:ATP-dependent DNA helicase RecQ
MLELDSNRSLEEHLKALFGYNDFRHCQKQIITTLLEQRDVVAILPTGAGKSICYQLPAMLMPGITVVISPLISLMQDQVVSLYKNGLPAAFLNSSLPQEEIRHLLQNLSSVKLLYIAPERLSDPLFIQHLKNTDVSLFAIDEAHCISQWGHAFRQEYRQLAFLKTTFPNAPIIALTATATKEVEQDIVSQLAMKEPHVIKASFDRPNLTFHVQEKASPMDQLRAFLRKHPGKSGVIYAATRKKVEEIYESLHQEGFNPGKYHAGLSDAERSQRQQEFIYGQCLIMVATVAFGMGIHKPDIRFVVHMDMPKSIEQYYQEVGRAGRDDLPAECLLLYSAQEITIYNLFLNQITDLTVRQTTRAKTEQMLSFCRSSGCRRKELLRYFGENYSKNQCNSCDRCLGTSELTDESVTAQKILSCVFRLRQSFGIKYLIDVLKGAKTKPIFDKGHDRLSTYNLMAEHSEEDLRYYISMLIEQGYLERSEGDYPVLRWSAISPKVISGELKFLISKRSPNKKPQKKRRDLECDQALFSQLSQLRQTFAQKSRVPAFVIFGDKSLIEMAKNLPTTQAEMLQINGVGPVKWERYGEAFLDVIIRYKSTT